MKHLLSILFLTNCILGQNNVDVEWIRPIPVHSVSDRLIVNMEGNDQKIFVAVKGRTEQSFYWNSHVYIIDPNSNILFVDTMFKYHVNKIQLYNNRIYSVGSNQINNRDNLLIRNINGTVLSKSDLLWKNNEYHFGNDGVIINDFLYSTYYLDDLLKFKKTGGGIL